MAASSRTARRFFVNQQGDRGALPDGPAPTRAVTYADLRPVGAVEAAGPSRRALFGAGVSRALGPRTAQAPASTVPAPASRAPAEARDADTSAAREAVARLGLSGGHVLVIGGDEPLAEAAMTTGCYVVVAEDARPALSGFDAVLAGFAASRDPEPRAMATVQMRRACRPGAPWPCWPRAGTPWARYETAYRHFCGLPCFDVEELVTPVGVATLVRARNG